MGIPLAGEQPWGIRGPHGPTTVVGVRFVAGEAVLDNAALHARSPVEQGVAFSNDPARKGRGERVAFVWVASAGERLVGACTVELWIDRAKGEGWKSPSDHVNRMSAAVRGVVDVAGISDSERRSLGAWLARTQPEAWAKAPELAKALGS